MRKSDLAFSIGFVVLIAVVSLWGWLTYAPGKSVSHKGWEWFDWIICALLNPTHESGGTLPIIIAFLAIGILYLIVSQGKKKTSGQD